MNEGKNKESKLPEKPDDKKKKDAVSENWLSQIKLAKRMHPTAEKICASCFAPIFSRGGNCPNGCDDK